MYRGVRGGVVDRWYKKDGTPSKKHGCTSRYAARYVDQEAKEHQRVFTLKREADVWLRQQLAAVDAHEHVSPRAGRISVKLFYEEFVEGTDGHQAKKTRTRRASWWRLYLEPRWGSVPVNRITPAAVRSWVTELVDKDLAPVTVRGIVYNLSSILAVAIEQKLIKHNPVDLVKLPPDKPARRHYLTHAQVKNLSNATLSYMNRESDALAILFMAYTGSRISETKNMDVSDINFATGRALVLDEKTKKTRSVPVPKSLLDRLLKLTTDLPSNSPLFPSARGKRLGNSWRNEVFAVAVTTCRAADSTFPHTTPHTLRHTAASLAVAAGASVLAVQRMLGHARPSMTLDTYSDLFDSDLDAVAVALDAAAAVA